MSEEVPSALLQEQAEVQQDRRGRLPVDTPLLAEIAGVAALWILLYVNLQVFANWLTRVPSLARDAHRYGRRLLRDRRTEDLPAARRHHHGGQRHPQLLLAAARQGRAGGQGRVRRHGPRRALGRRDPVLFVLRGTTLHRLRRVGTAACGHVRLPHLVARHERGCAHPPGRSLRLVGRSALRGTGAHGGHRGRNIIGRFHLED